MPTLQSSYPEQVGKHHATVNSKKFNLVKSDRKTIALKKLLTTLLAIFLFCFGFSQNQRLAILPSTMHGSGTDMPSICIDIFRDPPIDQTYRSIGGSPSSETFDVIDHTTVRKPPNSTTEFSSPKIIGETNEAVPTYYRRFIDVTTARYDDGSPISSPQLNKLQDEIWAFNGLDHFRFIDRNATDIRSNYISARRKFIQQFDLSAEDPSAMNRKIVAKLHELHELRSFPKTPIDNLSFSDRQISFTQDDIPQTLDVEYNEGLSGSLEPTEVTAGVNRYNNYYRVPPEQASAKPAGTDRALLTLSDEDELQVLKINVSLDRGTGLIQELEKLGIKVDNQLLTMVKKEKR